MHARLIIETVSWHLLDIIKCPDTPALALKFLNIENVFFTDFIYFLFNIKTSLFDITK